MECIIRDRQGNSVRLDLRFTKNGRAYFKGQGFNIDLIDFLTMADYIEMEYDGENHIYTGCTFSNSHQIYDRKDNLYFKIEQ